MLSAARRTVASAMTYEDMVDWLRFREGATVFVEIGGTDPVRDDYDVRYAFLHGVTLGRVSVVDVEPDESVAVVPITDLDDGSRLAFERHRFVDAKVHGPVLKVQMMHVYIGIAGSD
jgi:hypothetical protein